MQFSLLVLACLVVVTRKPTITKASPHDLGSNYSYMVEISHNAAILAHRQSNTILKYTMDSHDIKKVYLKLLPDGFQKDCRKYLIGDDRIVLRENNGSDPTRIYTSNLELMKTYVGDYGQMIGTVGNDMIVYTKMTSRHGCEVHIYSADNNHQLVLTLIPSAGRKWTYGNYGNLSVCRHSQARHIAVVDHENKGLDIYNKEGGF